MPSQHTTGCSIKHPVRPHTRLTPLLLALGFTPLAIAFSATPALADTFWWRGGANNLWSTISSGSPSTNFSSDASGVDDMGRLPGPNDAVHFACDNAANLSTTLGTDFTIGILMTRANLSADVSISGSSLTLSSSSILTFAPRTLTLNSAINPTQPNLFINTADASSKVVIASSMSGTFDVFKQGPGTLTLSNANTNFFTHGTTIFEGELRLTHPGAAGGFGASPISLGNGSGAKLTYATPNTTDFNVRGSVSVRRMNAVNVVNTNSGSPATLAIQGPASSYFDIALSRALVLKSDGTNTFFMGQITGPGTAAGNDSLILDSNNPGFFSLAPKDTGTQSLTNTYSGNLRVKSGNYEIQQHSYIADIPANSNLNIPDTASVTVDAGATLRFVWGDEAFDALNGSGTLTRNTADGQGHRTLTLGASGGTGQFSGTINSQINLTKSGSGTQILSGTNTYTGLTTISEGTLKFAQRLSLYNDSPASWTATNLVVESGATAAFNVGAAGEFTSGNIVTLVALGTATGGFKNGSILGLDTSNAPGGNFTHAPVIADTHGGDNSIGLTKLGNGTLTLTGDNTYSGITTISEGTLQIGDGGTSGSIAGNITNNTALVFNHSNNSTSPGIISGPGTLTKLGTGALTLSGSSTYSGGTTVSQGELRLTHPNAAGGFAASVITLGDESTGNADVKLTYAAPSTNDLTVRGSVGVRRMNAVNVAGTGSSGSATLGLSGPTLYYFDVALNRALVLTSEGTVGLFMAHITGQGAGAGNDSLIIDSGSTGVVVMAPKDTGTQSLANTYSGNLRVKSGNYEIQQHSYIANIPSNSNLNIPDTASVTVDAGATLRFVWGDEAFDALNGSGTLTRNTGDGQGIRTLTLGASGGTGHFSGTINSLLNLIKTGNGTQTLSGTNTYTGLTTISAGTLQIGNGGTTGSVVGNITNNAALVINRSNDLTLPGLITGSGSLSKLGTGTLTLAPGQAAPYQFSTLTISAGSLNTSDNDLIINYTGTSPQATLNGYAAASQLFASSDFGGIPTLMVFFEAADFGLTSFAGIPVDATTVLGKYTYTGDANLDGQVDAFDYSAIDDNFGTPGSFITGDLNQDGFVDAFDYANIDDTFGAGVGLPLRGVNNPLRPSGLGLPPSASTEVFIPEPTSLSLLIIASGLLSRKHRQS